MGLFFIRLLPAVAVVTLVIYLAIFFIVGGTLKKSGEGAASTKKRKYLPLLRHLPLYVLTGYVISLVYLTILWYYPDITFNPGYHSLNLTPFVWLTNTYEMGESKMIEQLLLNIGMFVPLGFLLPVASEKLRVFWRTALVCLATTLIIETLQYFMGRSADIDDVITNFVGGMLGYLVFALINRLFGNRKAWREVLGLSK